MILFVVAVVTLVIMVGSALYLSYQHELRLPAAVVLVILAATPLMNVICAVIALVLVATRLIENKRGWVVLRWRR